MKNFLLFTALLGFFFGGCSEDKYVGCETTDLEQKIAIVSCDDGYTTLESGDEITKTSEDDPEIEIIHSVDGNKSICVLSGEAEIIR